eukprot:TRINITY_DN615_c0_g2_i1.p1 TRINITY_DN615_c0_g2~~TRINITY_DN615_c0_g2_i1.p1  ORF type:complete len:356 (-),score=134.55 TRINITY_DN615_c0_g2_i1:205-1272(-)
MDLSALSSVKLKKTGVDPEARLVKPKDMMDEKHISAYQNVVLDFNIEHWLDLISDVTFATRFVPITMEHAQFFIDAYQQLEVDKKDSLQPEQQQILQQMALQLQPAIDAAKGDQPYVFVKTSSRSPKDAPAAGDKLKTLYNALMQNKRNQEEKAPTENDKIRALLRAGTESLRVETPTEALNLMIHSERIMQDMRLALQHPGRFQENFVIRQWANIDFELEFRTFVSNGQMTAMSQYYHLMYIDTIAQHHQAISQLILDFFHTRVAPRLSALYPKYIVDFALSGFDPAHPEATTVYVIELNPFLNTTDSCLFSWERERDLLENGPFEFRYRDAVVLGGRALLHDAWKKVLDEETD